ncbi:MAG: hypothetical protein P8165_05900 [Deltaproteobacteria bacterium]
MEAEDDDFDFYDSLKKVYRPIPRMRAFTRMEGAPAGTGGK